VVSGGSRTDSGSRGPAGHAVRAAFRPRRTTERPDVQPVDPEDPGECLCGDPAEFVVDTNWSDGRHSRDPVCGRHVAEVVTAITEKQARRNGG
jgi:hypothetical protein